MFEVPEEVNIFRNIDIGVLIERYSYTEYFAYGSACFSKYYHSSHYNKSYWFIVRCGFFLFFAKQHLLRVFFFCYYYFFVIPLLFRVLISLLLLRNMNMS
jgi:hypothetical protein